MNETNVNPTASDGGITIPGETGEPRQEARTFTQDEVNKIVQERLARSKADLAEKEKQIARQAFEQSAREVLRQKKLSDELLTVLNVSDLDGLNSALDILDKHFNYSNPHQAYIANGDGTWRKAMPGDINLPPCGHVDMGRFDGIREAMGLRHN